MGEGKVQSQPGDRPLSHFDSPVGVILTLLTFVGYVVALKNLPDLTPVQKWLFGVLSVPVAAVVCGWAWGLVDSIARLLAHLLWAAIFAANLAAVVSIAYDVFGQLDSIDSISKEHMLQAGLQVAMLFGANIVVFLILLPFARVTKVEPV